MTDPYRRNLIEFLANRPMLGPRTIDPRLLGLELDEVVPTEFRVPGRLERCTRCLASTADCDCASHVRGSE